MAAAQARDTSDEDAPLNALRKTAGTFSAVLIEGNTE
jgi:hypothetical protein